LQLKQLSEREIAPPTADGARIVWRVSAGVNPYFSADVLAAAFDRSARFRLGHQRCKAWPLATACGGKGLTTLVTQPVGHGAFDGVMRLRQDLCQNY
jgi:hypothetical protein